MSDISHNAVDKFSIGNLFQVVCVMAPYLIWIKQTLYKVWWFTINDIFRLAALLDTLYNYQDTDWQEFLLVFHYLSDPQTFHLALQFLHHLHLDKIQFDHRYHHCKINTTLLIWHHMEWQKFLPTFDHHLNPDIMTNFFCNLWAQHHNYHQSMYTPLVQGVGSNHSWEAI